MNLRNTIKEIVRSHLNNGGVAMGQCLTAVGWVGGTLPKLYEKDGMIEMPTCDVAGGGIAVGFALTGKRPIYIVRYQGFQWYNAITILNYAAKAKEMWGTPCPIFVRSIGMEGGMGPVAGNCHHGIYMRIPGVKIIAPITPNEYKETWQRFMDDDDPYYVSEHRKSFDIDDDLPRPMFFVYSDITLVSISITRLAAREAQKLLYEYGIKANVIDLLLLKPLGLTADNYKMIKRSRFGGLVLDTDYANGVAKPIANDISTATKKIIHVLALKEKAAGFSPRLDNLPPNKDEIVNKVRRIVK